MTVSTSGREHDTHSGDEVPAELAHIPLHWLPVEMLAEIRARHRAAAFHEAVEDRYRASARALSDAMAGEGAGGDVPLPDALAVLAADRAGIAALRDLTPPAAGGPLPGAAEARERARQAVRAAQCGRFVMEPQVVAERRVSSAWPVNAQRPAAVPGDKETLAGFSALVDSARVWGQDAGKLLEDLNVRGVELDALYVLSMAAQLVQRADGLVADGASLEESEAGRPPAFAVRRLTYDLSLRVLG